MIALLIIFLPILTVIILILAALTFLYQRGYFAQSTAVIPSVGLVILDRGSSIINNCIELRALPSVVTHLETSIHE